MQWFVAEPSGLFKALRIRGNGNKHASSKILRRCVPWKSGSGALRLRSIRDSEQDLQIDSKVYFSLSVVLYCDSVVDTSTSI